MTAPAHDTTRDNSRKGLGRVVTAAMAGTVVEWYEFFLYATASTIVFNLIMFPPSDDPYAAIINAFLIYGVGFVALALGKTFLLDGSLRDLTDLLTPIGWDSVLLMFPFMAGVGALVSAITAWVTLRFYLRV